MSAAQPVPSQCLTGRETLAFAQLCDGLDAAVLAFVGIHSPTLGSLFRDFDAPEQDLRAAVGRLVGARRIEFVHDGTGSIGVALTDAGWRKVVLPAEQPISHAMAKLAKSCNGAKKTVREAAADTVLYHLILHPDCQHIDGSALRAIRLKTGLSEIQIERGIDDLVAADRLDIFVEAGFPVFEPRIPSASGDTQ